MKTIYDGRTKDSALRVSIDRYGVHIEEATYVGGYEGFGDCFLKQFGHFSWEDIRRRERTYCGDDGSGRIRARLTAAAISLLGYWGGTEETIETLDQF